MIYRPSVGSMWDPSVLWHDGKFYAIMMYNPTGCNTNGGLYPSWPSGLSANCGIIAVSDDGVHWRDEYVAATEPGHATGNRFFKAFIGKVGDRFIMDHGVRQANGRQDTLRFYESRDLREWTYLFSNNPDPQWYEPAGRWDHMYMLPKDEDDPAAGYWGYPVATTKPGLPRALGMMDTRDGREWRILPPPDVQWGDVPPTDFEIGGCERIGGKYVIIGGQYHYQSDGYSMYTLIGEGPCGPFRPDRDAFRLCGTSTKAGGWAISMLAAWCRGERDEKLISNYVNVPSGTWMLPLRKAVFDGTHLRLGWWKSNDSLKGNPIALNAREVTLKGGVNGRQITWLEPAFDLGRGVILEGTICGVSLGAGASAGFAFEENADCTMEIRLGIGTPEHRETYVGRHHPLTGFCIEDTTGRGCATVTGIGNGTEHTFRLLARHDLFELYIDDLLVQTYTYRPYGGRIGVVASAARVTVTGIIAHAMTL